MRAWFGGAAAVVFLVSAAHGAQADLQRTVAAYLNAYASGDKAAAEAGLEPDVRLYGSDASEIYSGKAGFERMFANDMKLWNGQAKFGAMTDVSTVREGDLATIFFDVPFSVGHRPPVPVRVAMTWRLEGGAWKLAQSSNTVPTVGQSAEILLGAQKR